MQGNSTIRTLQLFSVWELEEHIKSAIREEELTFIDVPRIIDEVIKKAHPVIPTTELAETLAYVCAQLAHIHPAYEKVAGRLAISHIHKETPSTFAECFAELSKGPPYILLSSYRQHVEALLPDLEEVIDEQRDFEFTYDAVMTLQRYYLLGIGERIVERPQFMFMRLAVAICDGNLDDTIETYRSLSAMEYFHAPTAMVYAGTTLGQVIPHFSMPFNSSSQGTMMYTLSDCAVTSYTGGATALGITDFPADGEIKNGVRSNGLRSLLTVLDDVVERIGRGATRGRGKVTVFLEPWHAEFEVFLRENRRLAIRQPSRSRGVLFALWVPDIFLKRVEARETWSLFRPGDVPELISTSGSTFETLYCDYERRGLATQTLSAKYIWDAILDAQVETSGPSIMYKDAVNRTSNFSHLGCLNLGGEFGDIAMFCGPYETGVCNTANMVLPNFISSTGHFDYEHLHYVTKLVTRNLNKLLVHNSYPTMASVVSFTRHRAIGIGILGLADVFIALRIPFESKRAMETGARIMQTIYHAALETSLELVSTYGCYPSFPGSPMSHGILQFDNWDSGVTNEYYEWDIIREQIRNRGIANSQVTVLSNSSASSRLAGVTEGFEPLLSNLLVKRQGNIKYKALNPTLVRDLISLNLWNEQLRLRILICRGSIQSIDEIPDFLKELYKTAWEIDPESLVQHAIYRAPFVCQSQSLILYREVPTRRWLSSILFYSWRRNLKTGLFFLRTRNPPFLVMDSPVVAE